jgi:hypothetical protein
MDDWVVLGIGKPNRSSRPVRFTTANPIKNRHHTHIIATHVDGEAVGFVDGDVDLGVAGFAIELLQLYSGFLKERWN